VSAGDVVAPWTIATQEDVSVPLQDLGRVLLVLGLVIAPLGLLFLLVGRVPALGRLPGDIVIERDNVRIYIPIATSILISILLTLLFLVFGAILGRR